MILTGVISRSQSLGGVLCKDAFHACDFEVVALASGDLAVDAGADADVSRDALGALCVYGGVTVVNGLGDLRPWSFYTGGMYIMRRDEMRRCPPMLVPYPLWGK